MRERWTNIFIIMLATSIFGELKLNPFGESFRISLGITAYFFGLLWFRNLSPLTTGFVVGTWVFIFRMAVGVFIRDMNFWDLIPIHAPSALFYYIFAIVVDFAKLRARFASPVRVGIVGALADVAANSTELVTRISLGQSYAPTVQILVYLTLLGALRSFFVVGLYNILMINQVRAVSSEKQRQLEQLLLLHSSLYEEAMYLQKSMHQIETITQDSYHLYNSLRQSAVSQVASQALHVAEEVHEIKKDYQRILAGVEKLIGQQPLATRISLSELIRIAAQSNRNYADMLGKDIHIHTEGELNLSTNQIYPLLSSLNNLLANAVEAIPTAGQITIRSTLENSDILIAIEDDGPGIRPDDLEWILRPGYTTKYDSQGNSSTGIGLTHVHDLLLSLNGRLSYSSRPGHTEFLIRIPSLQLLKKEADT